MSPTTLLDNQLASAASQRRRRMPKKAKNYCLRNKADQFLMVIIPLNKGKIRIVNSGSRFGGTGFQDDVIHWSLKVINGGISDPGQ